MNELATVNDAALAEQTLLMGDLSKLSPAQRTMYYMKTCESLGLNPMTKPFDFLTLNGKMVMYAKRDAADQLRKLHGVNIRILSQRAEGDLYLVTVEAMDKTGRTDQDIGAVTLPKGGDIRANAILKCITKAKRRVTLSICGLGFLDETEVEDIPSPAKKFPNPPHISASPTPAAGLSAPSPEKPFDSAEGAGNLSREGFDDIEIQIDDALADAATKGLDALKHEWAATHKSYHAKLKPRLDNVHKPAAMKVTA